LAFDVAPLAESLPKALDQERSAFSRANGQKNRSRNLSGLLAGHVAARQSQPGQGQAPQEPATAMEVHTGLSFIARIAPLANSVTFSDAERSGFAARCVARSSERNASGKNRRLGRIFG
jgi:hypothetical protein